MEKKKYLLIIVLCLLITCGAIGLERYTSNKLDEIMELNTNELSIDPQTIKSLLVEKESSIKSEDLFEEVYLLNENNILYHAPVYHNGRTYEYWPFMVNTENWKWTYGINKPSVQRFFDDKNYSSGKYVAEGRIVIPTADVSLPFYSTIAGFEFTDTVPWSTKIAKGTDIDGKKGKGTILDYNYTEIVGHSVTGGMGDLIPGELLKNNIDNRRGVKLGDIAYVFYKDGTTEFYKASIIEPHANEHNRGYDDLFSKYDNFPSDYFDSNGELFIDKYLGKGIDILYTDCCNDGLIDYDDKYYGNYAIIWEKIS